MQKFMTSTASHYGAAFGEYSTATRDKLGAVRTAYKNSSISKSPVTSYEQVKSRPALVKYAAYRLNFISNYPFSSETDAKNVAASLDALISRWNRGSQYAYDANIVDMLINGFKGAMIRDRQENEKALQFFVNKGLYWLSKTEMAQAKTFLERTATRRKTTAEASEKRYKEMTAEGDAIAKASGFDDTWFSKVWNDGKYQYTISSVGVIRIGDKTFQPGTERHGKIVAQLKKDRASGKLKPGSLKSAPARAAQSATLAPAEVAPVAAETPELPEAPADVPEEGITSKPWFWPAVVLGTAGTGGAVWYFFFRSKGQ